MSDVNSSFGSNKYNLYLFHRRQKVDMIEKEEIKVVHVRISSG